MSAPTWLRFTGQQPKRKRAELACVICHGKKVCHGLYNIRKQQKKLKMSRLNAISKYEAARDITTARIARPLDGTAGMFGNNISRPDQDPPNMR